MQLNSVLVTAYAKAPQNTIIYEQNKNIGIVLEIDKASHIVINAEIMFVTNLAKDYFRRLILGTDFSKDLNNLLNNIETDLLIPSQQAVIVAIKIAHQRYLDSYLKKSDKT